MVFLSSVGGGARLYLPTCPPMLEPPRDSPDPGATRGRAEAPRRQRCRPGASSPALSPRARPSPGTALTQGAHAERNFGTLPLDPGVTHTMWVLAGP